MTPDRELLRQYAEEGSEAAFAELVRRHVDWIYSAALRLVAGDAHRAQDVTQNVFADLARKASKLWRHETLIGWLHTSTRFAALGAIRGEQRRHAREQEAGIMNEPTTAEVNWEQLRPMLDEAVGHLKDEDRHALLLRFFQGMNHQQIGAVLGLSEDTARKRVERALEKLRAVLARQGITTSSAFLVLALGANTVQAAPPSFAAKVADASLADAGETIVANSLWKAFFMTTKTKSILAASVVLVALIAWLLISSNNSGETSATKKPAASAQAQPPTLATSPKPPPDAMSAPALSPAVAVSALSPPSIPPVMVARTSPDQDTQTLETPTAKTQATQAIAVRNNLFRITIAAQTYMLDHHVSEVRYTDLVADKSLSLVLRSVVPAAGEKYDDLIVRETDTSLSLAVPGLGIITFDPAQDLPPPPSIAQNTDLEPVALEDKGTLTFTEGVPVTMTSTAGDLYTVTATSLPGGGVKISYSSEQMDANGEMIGISGGTATIGGPNGIVSIPKLGITFKLVMN